MNHIAVSRLTIFITVSIIAGLLIFFEPSLNIGTSHVISMYDAVFKHNMPARPILMKLFIMVGAIFLAQLFLIGLTPKEKHKKKPKKKKVKK